MKLRLMSSGDVVGVAEPIPVSVRGVETGTSVGLRVTCEDGRGVPWRSEAIFVADGGAVDPRRHPSVGGSYVGVDPYGLWWTLSGPGQFAPGAAFRTTVEAVLDGEVVGRVCFERRWLVDGMTSRRVADGALVGECYLPARLPAPAVMVLGGSEGGLMTAAPQAAALASCGLVGVAVAYFGLPGLPDGLANIPLEYFEAALEWIADHPAVAGDGIGVLGRSRGGELALLLGATFPRLRAVVGIVPSGIVWGRLSPGLRGPAWTHQGRRLPFVSGGGIASVAKAFARPPAAIRPVFEEALRDAAAVAAATIPVERTAGPILLVSGGDDQLSPSERLSGMVVDRMRDLGQESQVLHLSYPAAGHFAGGLPFLPAGPVVAPHPMMPGTFDYGGDRAANGRSSSDAWPRIAEFLRVNLGAGPVAARGRTGGDAVAALGR